MILAVFAWLEGASQPEASGSEDEAGLLAAAKTDPSAFEPLYQRYVGPVYRYLRLHSPSDEDAADMTQQVFLKALVALPNYHERGVPFGAWLFRIARNLAINATQRKRPTVTWDLLPAPLEPLADTGDPEAEALRQEKIVRLRQILANLDHQKLEILALHFGSDLTLREIAPIVGKSEAAVKKQLSRTVNYLKEQYGEER